VAEVLRADRGEGGAEEERETCATVGLDEVRVLVEYELGVLLGGVV